MRYALAADVDNQDIIPRSTIKLVVAFAPGGSSDVFARTVAEKLGQKIDRVVIVDNKPGANGIVAMQTVATSRADGTTLLMSQSNLGIQAIKPNAKLDLRRDFAPIVLFQKGYHTLFVDAQLPVTNMKELIEYEKSHPGKLNYASFGVGSTPHFAMEYLNMKTGMNLVHIAYKSNLEAIQSVMKGDTQLSMSPYAGLKPFIDAKKIRAIATLSPDSLPSSPGVPGMRQAGVADFDLSFWFGFHTTKSTPERTLNYLNQAFNAVLQDPSIQQQIADVFGAQGVGGTQKEFADFVAADIKNYDEIARRAHIVLAD